MGAALLRHALAAEEEPLKSWPVLSAGVAAYHGDGPSEHTVRALQKVGIDISQHRSQRADRSLVGNALVIFVMTESHRIMLEHIFPQLVVPVYLFREFLPPPENGDIPDPYGSDLAVYEACRDSMVEAIPSIVRYLKTLVVPPS